MGGRESRSDKTRRESDGEDKVPIYCPLNGLPPEYCEYYPVGTRRPSRSLRPRGASMAWSWARVASMAYGVGPH